MSLKRLTYKPYKLQMSLKLSADPSTAPSASHITTSLEAPLRGWVHCIVSLWELSEGFPLEAPNILPQLMMWLCIQIYLGMKTVTSQIKAQPWQNVDFFFFPDAPPAPLLSVPHDLVCILHHQMIQTWCHRGPCSGIHLLVLLKPLQGGQTCWGIYRLLCGDGPLRPDLSAVMLLDNKFSPADRNLVDSSQSWLAQRKAMFQPGQDNVYSDPPSQPDSSSLLEILHILLSPSVPTHMQYTSSFLYHLWKCNFFPFPSCLLLTSFLEFNLFCKNTEYLHCHLPGSLLFWVYQKPGLRDTQFQHELTGVPGRPAFPDGPGSPGLP